MEANPSRRLVQALKIIGCPNKDIIEENMFDHLFEIPQLAQLLNGLSHSIETKDLLHVSAEREESEEKPVASRLLESEWKEFSSIKEKECSTKQAYIEELEKQTMLLRLQKQKLENNVILDNKKEQISKDRNSICFGNNRKLQNECTENLHQISQVANNTKLNESRGNIEFSIENFLLKENVVFNDVQLYLEKHATKIDTEQIDKSQSSVTNTVYHTAESFQQSNNLGQLNSEALRLKKCLTITQEKLFKVEVEIAGQNAVKKWSEAAMNNSLAELKSNEIRQSLEAVKCEISAVEEALSDNWKDLKTISQNKANKLLSEVVAKNYAFKLECLKKVLSMQSEILATLLQQNSRLGFVHVALQIEVNQQKELLNRLENLITDLEKERQRGEHRSKWYEELNSCTESSLYVPETDNILQAVYSLIVQNEEELIPSYKTLEKSAETANTTNEDLIGFLKNCQLEIKQLLQELFGDVCALKDGLTGLSQESICSQSHTLKQLFGLFESEAKRLQNSVTNCHQMFAEKVKLQENPDVRREDKRLLEDINHH